MVWPITKGRPTTRPLNLTDPPATPSTKPPAADSRRPPRNRSLPTQQMPSLPITSILMPLAIRREMQRAISPPHQRIRNDVPGINRNQINRKKIHPPTRIPLPLRPHHIQAITLSPPLINRRLHLHPQNPPLA